MLTGTLEKLLRSRMRGEVRCGETLALHTSLRVGGPADFFVIPADRDDLKGLVALLAETATPYLVLGGGYNLLVRDGGFRGVVISLGRFDRVELLADGCVLAEAGLTNQRLVRFTEEAGLTGLEFLCGIPGTVGGALAVNAGAHGEAVMDRVETLASFAGATVTVYNRDERRFSYRSLELVPGEIILSAAFRLSRGERREIEGRVEAFLAHRHSAQRVRYPSAGSFFKNPPGGQAWRLIDAAGFRGHCLGGAQVAEAHANFLVNRGGATAADFIRLAGLIKEKVRAQSGIELEEEVRIVGEDRDQGPGNGDRHNQ